MRIKCPFEPFDNAPDYNLEELIWHFDQTHECHPPIIGQRYAQLIFKIHERIESLEKYQPQNYDDNDLQNVVLKELKSLLNGDIGQ